MKTLLFLLLLPCSLFAGNGEEVKVYIPYTVTYRVNKLLDAGNAEIVLVCNRYQLHSSSYSLDYSINNVSAQAIVKHGQETKLSSKPQNAVFQFYIGGGYEEIYTDSIEVKAGVSTVITLDFQPGNNYEVAEKPVIYLYPESDLSFTATVVPKGTFTFTYPTYKNGWTGTAHPDGSVTVDGKTYPYLFWEAELKTGNLLADRSGFVVEKANVISFLEEKLTVLGLNATEQTDFITYWGPRLAGHNRCFVKFTVNESCSSFAELDITPAPAHINRVYIVWTALESNEHPDVKAQQLPTFNRSGFDVLEWGGTECFPSDQL